MSTEERPPEVGEAPRDLAGPEVPGASAPQTSEEADAEVATYTASFDEEIAEAQAFERKLFWREMIAVGVVVAMVIVRQLWLS